MKLSQLSTDRALDVLCELTPLVSEIVSDEALMATLGKAVKRDGLTRAGVLLLGAERLARLTPLLLKEHRAAVYGIVAALNGVEPEAVAAQGLLETAAQLRELCMDQALLDFFKSCAGPEAGG